MTKRICDSTGWVRRVKLCAQKNNIDISGVYIKTSDVKKHYAFIPKWIAVYSDVLEHVFDNTSTKKIEYPANNVNGVRKNSIEDVVLLYRLSRPLLNLFENQNFKWLYNSKNRVMEKVLHTVYKWRTRLGFLISTASFFGFTMLQNLADAVIKFRVETSYSRDIKKIIFFSYRDNVYKTNALLDFFVEKLKYEKIHYEMITSWITNEVLNEWICKLIFCNGEVLPANAALPYLIDSLKFKPLFCIKLSFKC